MRRHAANGYVRMRWQPGVMRHATLATGKPERRAVHLRFQRGDLDVAIEVPDPAMLLDQLQHAIEWVAEEPEAS